MDRVLTVKQINNYIAGVFDDELVLHDICVTGEISEFKISANNTYIVLKEDDNILECYKYGRLEPFEKGANVRIRGKIKYYTKSSRISLSITEIKYSGEGGSHREFEKLKERLRIGGYFNNPLKLPEFITNVVLVTSADGAVVHDFFSVISGRNTGINVDVLDVSVQGESSRDDIIRAIEATNRNKSADVIVIARGGGSYQDLLSFNTEEMAMAVFNSKIPVISAVGHESDYTLCDFCAVCRAPTPSIAAEIISKINQSRIDRFFSLMLRMREILSEKAELCGRQVSLLTRRLANENEMTLEKLSGRVCNNLRQAYAVLEKKEIACEVRTREVATKLFVRTEAAVKREEGRFYAVGARLDSLSPLKLLSAGYARVLDGDVSVVSVDGLCENQTVKVVMQDGSFISKISKIERKDR